MFSSKCYYSWKLNYSNGYDYLKIQNIFETIQNSMIMFIIKILTVAIVVCAEFVVMLS